MKTIRTNASALPVSLIAVKEHLRFDCDFEDEVIDGMTASAVAEIEDFAEIALRPQTITATTYQEVGAEDLDLPIGPVAEGAALTVQTLASDGTLSTLSDGYWLEAGRYPVLHMTTAHNTRLRITYAAGYDSLPDDLALAVKEQVARAFVMREGATDRQPIGIAAVRIVARYKRVRA